jgi:hypothetical protein
LFGIEVEGVPPQVSGLTVTPGLAVPVRTVFVAAMSRTSCGLADQRSATTPATCGPAIDVPLKNPYAVSVPLKADRTKTPGAEISGFKRFGV